MIHLNTSLERKFAYASESRIGSGNQDSKLTDTQIKAFVRLLGDGRTITLDFVANKIKNKKEQAIPVLIEILKDHSSYSEDTHLAAIDLLREIGYRSKNAEKALCEILEEKTSERTIRAVGALEKIGTKDSLPALYKAMENLEKVKKEMVTQYYIEAKEFISDAIEAVSSKTF